MAESKYNVPNLERALKIIEFLAKQPNPMGTSELAEELGYPKNSVFRIVKTLVNMNYLISNNNLYQLSTKFLAVGYKALGEGNLTSKAMNPMMELRDESRETVILGKLSGYEGVVLEAILSNEPVKFVIDAGHHFKLHTSAPAKAILAFTAEEEREEIINSIDFIIFNENTIKDKQQFEQELVSVRKKEYALDMGEEIAGLYSLAAPIFNYQKRPIAAIWITGPSFRMPIGKFDEYGAMVKKHAARISTFFGYDQLQEE